MADEDYGKASREEFKKKNPGKEDVDKAYLEGEEQSDPKGLTAEELKKLRRRIAERASRYLRPAHGYKDKDHTKGPFLPPPGHVVKPKLDPKTEGAIGGGIYRKEDVPLTDAERCAGVYKWVEDVFWPKDVQPGGTDPDLHENWAKIKILESGAIDVAKRLDPKVRRGWYCIEHACFLAYLLRALGYKVQYKTILPSNPPDKTTKSGEINFVPFQTAAVNVWHDGRWNFYDPFLSFSHADGGIGAYTDKEKKCNEVCFDGEDIDASRPGFETPFHDFHSYVWAEPHYKGWKKEKDGGLPIFGGDLLKKTKKDQDEFMKGKGWTPHVFYSEAGVGFKNVRPELRMGVQFGPAACGYTSMETFESSLAGAVYQPYGRPAGPMMADPRIVPAEDEWIRFNVYEEGLVPLQLCVTNRSGAKVRYEIHVGAGDSPYLGIGIEQTAIRGTLRPGQTRVYDVPLQVRAIAHRPPPPVRNLKAYPQRDGNTVLHWSPVPGATSYLVYRSGEPLSSSADFTRRRAAARTAAPCYHAARAEDTVFYAVNAVNEHGLDSGPDPECGSYVAVTPRGRRR